MARKPKTNVKIGGKSYYRTTLNLGLDSDGKQKQKQFYGKSKAEAERKKQAYIRDMEAGIKQNLATQTLQNAMYSWLWTMEHPTLKEQTFERAEGIYRNYVMNSKIADIQVGDFTAMILQDYYNHLAQTKKTASQIRKLHKLLNKFFNFVTYEGYIRRNPCFKLKIKEDKNTSKIQTFTTDDIAKIRQLPDTDVKYLMLMAFATGARLGELLALEYTDIKDGIVSINKTLSYIKIYSSPKKWHYENRVQPPKTKSSIRDIPLPKGFMPILKKIRKLNAEQKLKLGPAYADNSLLFPSQIGTLQNQGNLRKRYKKTLKEAGVEYKNIHAMRHTYATQLLEHGENLVTVSKLLGHASIQTTEMYLHVSQDSKKQAAERLSVLFN